MKIRYSAAVTILILGLLGGAPALAQETSDAGSLRDAAPMATDAAKPAETPATASEVATSDGEGETDQGDADEQSPAELGTDLYSAIRAGKWLVAVGFALLLLVGGARRFGGKWAKTKVGGYVLGFGVPMLGALGLSLSTGIWSVDIFLGAFSAGLAASGLHTAAKDVKGSREA